jgi:hypothetical protein
MNAKQTHTLIKLVREHFKLQADVQTLAAMLETSVNLGRPPVGWLKALKLARQEPNYRNISEQFETQLVELERSLDESELARLVDSIPQTDFPN